MTAPFFILALALIVFLILVLAACLFRRSCSSPYAAIPALPWREYLPPGGRVLALLLDSHSIRDALTDLSRQYGDVFQLWLGPTRVVVCSSPADVVQLLSSADFDRPAEMRFVLHKTVPNSILVMTPSRHHSARRCLRDCFNFSHLPAFHGPMQDAVSELVHSLESVIDDSPTGVARMVDLAHMLSTVTIRIITNVAFGSNWTSEFRRQFAMDVDDFLDGLLVEVLGYPIRSYVRASEVHKHLCVNRDRIRWVCESLVRERMKESASERERRPADVLDAILSFEDQCCETATSHMVVFVLGGAHTVNHTMCWLLFRLSQDEEVLQKVMRELEEVGCADVEVGLRHEDVERLVYLKRVWRETLRLHHPGGIFMREAVRDVWLKGSQVVVPKGTRAVALPHRTQTHEKYWTEAEMFRPERWEGEEVGCGGTYVPFGVGARNCPAQFFADHEGVLVVGEVLRRFRVELGCRAEEVVMRTGWTVVGRYELWSEGCRRQMGIPFNVSRKCD